MEQPTATPEAPGFIIAILAKEDPLKTITFGIDSKTELCWTHSAELCSTKTISVAEARAFWRSLREHGYTRIDLTQDKAITSLRKEIIICWLRFCDTLRDNSARQNESCLNHSDPCEALNMRLKNGNEAMQAIKDYNEEGRRDDAEREITKTIGRRGTVMSDQHFGDFDNYWNQEGVFESQTDYYPPTW